MLFWHKDWGKIIIGDLVHKLWYFDFLQCFKMVKINNRIYMYQYKYTFKFRVKYCSTVVIFESLSFRDHEKIFRDERI